MSLRAFFLVGIPLLLGVGCGGADDAAQAERPHAAPAKRIVLITVDTLRADSVFGETPAMPRLAARAADATRFTNFWASTSTTQPTHASLFTGLHPWEHGVVRNGVPLGEEHHTVAEWLAAVGWQTDAVVASFPLAKRYGFDQGFETYVDRFTRGEKAEWNGEAVGTTGFYALADEVLASTRDALANTDGRPQFLWLHLFDPHAPYGDLAGGKEMELRELASSARRADGSIDKVLKRARRLYDADVAALDSALDALLTEILDAPEVETHLVLSSDHGESFGEDGSFGHGKRVTPSQVHVPTLIFSPDFEAGERTDAAGTPNLFATLIHLAGEWTGRDIENRPLQANLGQRLVAGMRQTFPEGFSDPRTDGSEVLVDEPRFFLAMEGGFFQGNRYLMEDESRSVARSPDDNVGVIFGRFEDALRDLSEEVSLDPEELRALRALGYTEGGKDG